ncbi:hypothetical protein CR513_17078, partial [Mucuna pruriens]
HFQTNDQAKSTNRVILRELRRRLEETKGRWAKELSQVLWSYHTTSHFTTQETSFRLTFEIRDKHHEDLMRIRFLVQNKRREKVKEDPRECTTLVDNPQGPKLEGKDKEKEKVRSDRSPKKGSEPFQGCK